MTSVDSVAKPTERQKSKGNIVGLVCRRDFYLQYLSTVQTFGFVPRTKLGPSFLTHVVQDI